MQKLVYVLEHCSTGGMPAYVLKMIEHFREQFKISVIEINYFGHYEVQRKKIQSLVDFYSLEGDQSRLMPLIDKIAPDIIHIQEIPEQFITTATCNQIFNWNRKYAILITTHSSHTEPSQLKYYPDRFVLVNKWSRNKFADYFKGIECDIWEYPIENKPLIGKKAARYKLVEMLKEKGYDVSKHASTSGHVADYTEGKHILNIGLFTPGKNQGELFEIARKDHHRIYHFVGNQAPNFEFYWKPLMDTKPDNCIIWGEREDVDLFYQACDEMWHVSKLELNPLCIREALSYGLRVKMYKLHTYLDDYDDNPLVSYL